MRFSQQNRLRVRFIPLLGFVFGIPRKARANTPSRFKCPNSSTSSA